MKFADGFDTDKEHKTCPNGYRVVSVPTKYGNKIVAICINDKGSALRIYTEDGGFYSMPITTKYDKQKEEDFNRITEERDNARRACTELTGDVMNMEKEIKMLKDKLFIAKYCTRPI